MASQDKKLIDCFWFLQNKCSKGTSCDFRHCEEAQKNQSVCSNWIENKCQDLKCAKRHPSGVNKAVVTCYYFLHGGCMKGTDCPYSHSESSGGSGVSEMQAITKKAEEELKALQQARAREEAKLAKIKEEQLLLANSKQNNNKNKNNDKPPVNTRLSTNKNTKNNNNNNSSNGKFNNSENNSNNSNSSNNTKRKRDINSANSKSNDVLDFGIKPLDVLLKEKQETPATNASTSTSSSSSSSTISKDTSGGSNKKNIDLESLRKRNELKFKSEVPTKTLKTTTTTESPKEKKLKAEPTNTITPSTSINELDDFEKELDSLPPPNKELIVDTENLEEDIDIDEDLDIM